MITFCIPLRSKQVSRDWEGVCRIFNRTLHSVYRQTDPDFRIYIACHEIPELEHHYDERVQFLVSDSPIPQTHDEMLLDKGWKIELISRKIRENGGGYTMLVDADDLVSNRIAEYAAQHPGENGFLSDTGYIYNEGDTYCKQVRRLHRTCGSCSIVNYTVEDLPEQMPENLWDERHVDTFIIRKSHRQIPDYMASLGRPLQTIPFPITVYVRNTGENHSMLKGNDLSWKRKVELLIQPRIPIERLREEFGF
ncbi:MAG: hypothetical protein IJV51_03490 [Oscillospiraceae bacterium]|nr:hypothetical protein [Oscillospiraceae bacterium]